MYHIESEYYCLLCTSCYSLSQKECNSRHESGQAFVQTHAYNCILFWTEWVLIIVSCSFICTRLSKDTSLGGIWILCCHSAAQKHLFTAGHCCLFSYFLTFVIHWIIIISLSLPCFSGCSKSAAWLLSFHITSIGYPPRSCRKTEPLPEFDPWGRRQWQRWEPKSRFYWWNGWWPQASGWLKCFHQAASSRRRVCWSKNG